MGKQIGVWVDDEVYELLCAESYRLDRSISWIVKRMVESRYGRCREVGGHN